MASMPWVKLYTEILDDPKMAELSATEKWLFIELILLAGECDQEGEIPMTLKQIAWRLREDQASLDSMLISLNAAELITYDASGVFVLNFAKRQDRSQSVKRQQWNDAQRRHREKSESVIHDTSMTHTPREDKIREDKIREDKDKDKSHNTGGQNGNGEIFKIYEQEIGVISPAISDRLIEAEQVYPRDWIIQAVKIAVNNNARNWAYCEAILKRWQENGSMVLDKPKARASPGKGEETISEKIQRVAKERDERLRNGN